MSFSLAFWSSVSVFGNNTSNVTYRSPFLLLWYSGMPSPLNFLISLGLVIPCESVKIEISCQLCHTTIILLLGGHVFTLVPISTRWLSRCLIVFSKPTRDCSWNSNMRLEGEGELTTRLAGKTRENCWTATSWIQEYKDVLYWFFQRASSRWSSKFRSSL